MKTYTISELAAHAHGTVVGDDRLVISGVAGLDDAGPGQITFLANPKYRAKVHSTNASAIIAAPDVEAPGRTLIQVENPYLAFAQVVTLFSEKKHPPVGIHETCVRGEHTTIGDQCAIGPHVTLGNHVSIGDRTILYPGVVVGDGVSIGADCILYPNVSLLQDIRLGNHVIINAGAVIGSEGFGFAPDGESTYKIPQIGTVIIEDHVEIGANVTIDRAALGHTLIQQGVKIDNLVQIAHNVVIGEHSIIVAQVGISGSSKLGKHVILAGQVGLVGHIELADNVVVGAQSGVTKSVKKQTMLSGSPAVDHRVWRKSQVALLKLPDALKTIKALEARIQALEHGE